MSRREHIVSLGLAWVAATVALQGQWTTQTIALRPGWNAVYLGVQPEPRECDAVLASLEVERVVAWNRRFRPVQFIQDPTAISAADPDWLTYLPPEHPLASATTLFILEAGRSYLIKLRETASPTNWNVHGRAAVSQPVWLSDSLNLVGFAVDPVTPPTFASFFGNSPAHAGNPVYRLESTGHWTRIQNPSAVPLMAGEAFWIQTTGPSDFAGPFQVVLDQQRRLDFGRTLTEQTVRIRNCSGVSKTFIVKPLTSANPPTEDYPVLAGEVPLAYWLLGVGGWQPLSGQILRTVPAGGEWPLRLAVCRKDMAPFTPPPGAVGALYQSLLEVTDAAGSGRYLIPVTAQGLQAFGSPLVGDLRPMGDTVPHPRAGLWIGSAVINSVSQPASGNPTEPVPTASGYQFRLLIHVDSDGQARLLQRVLQMWKDGTYKPDPADLTKLIVDVPGRYVLLTDEALAADYTGATLRDGQPVGRRFSTTAFGFRDPIPMDGVFGESGSSLSCSVVLDYDDPLNPFKHSYHPDHDNRDARFEQKLPEGQESFTVTRQLELEFTDTDPDNLALAGWGDNQLGGVFREVLTGLHKSPLYVQGTFRLHQASRVAVLNDPEAGP